MAEIMEVEITVGEMMVAGVTSEQAAEVEDDTYEFPFIFCMHGFRIGDIFCKLRSY
jgi:hypothetical protein